MHIVPIKTHKIKLQESAIELWDRYISDLEENTIVVITSKIISVLEGRLVCKNTVSKEALIRQEADCMLKSSLVEHMSITIKDGLLLMNAGIDESNGDGFYILYPLDVWQSAYQVWLHLRQRHGCQNLGVLITDSHTRIMRRGVTGMALSWCGFDPLYSYVGQTDLYERLLRVTQLNVADSLAAAAVLVMGEGSEQTPIALIKKAPHVTFQDRPPTPEEHSTLCVDAREDIYAPLWQEGIWKKK